MAVFGDCFSEDDFTDEPDGKLHLLHHDGDASYTKHDEWYYGSYDLTGLPIADGIGSPSPGPASPSVDVCAPLTNPWPDEMVLEFQVKADLIVLGSGGTAGRGALLATVSPDGVLSYQTAQYTQFTASGGGAFSSQGFNSWSGSIFWTLPMGWTGTPRCTLAYANYAGAAAGLIQCTLIEARIHIHRH